MSIVPEITTSLAKSVTTLDFRREHLGFTISARKGLGWQSSANMGVTLGSDFEVQWHQTTAKQSCNFLDPVTRATPSQFRCPRHVESSINSKKFIKRKIITLKIFKNIPCFWLLHKTQWNPFTTGNLDHSRLLPNPGGPGSTLSGLGQPGYH